MSKLIEEIELSLDYKQIINVPEDSSFLSFWTSRHDHKYVEGTSVHESVVCKHYISLLGSFGQSVNEKRVELHVFNSQCVPRDYESEEPLMFLGTVVDVSQNPKHVFVPLSTFTKWTK